MKVSDYEDYIKYVYNIVSYKEPYNTDFMVSLRDRMYNGYSEHIIIAENSCKLFCQQANKFGYKVDDIKAWMRNKKIEIIIGNEGNLI